MERPLPIEPEELLSQARWMRALARGLVNDSATADDVVQESMIAALRRPPDSTGSLPSWLARVVRNVASNFRRGEQRLAERHAARGAGEAVVDPSATVERLDTQRLLVDLVRELDEPARSTIVLRYFEGLSSPEIGRRMGVSDATVRWRLQKALHDLRARLQRKSGSRDAWCAMLAPFASPFKITGTLAATAGATAGAMTMGAMSKIGVAAVSLSIVGAGLWFTLDQEEPALRTAEAAAPASSEGPNLIEPVAPAALKREALTFAAEAASPTDASAATANAGLTAASEWNAHVRARFVDSNGQPWEGVSFQVIDVYAWMGGQSRRPANSGADGGAELSFMIPDGFRDPNFQFAATRLGCATRTMRVSLVIGGVVDLGDVVLESEASIQGTVHDARGIALGEVAIGLWSAAAKAIDPGQLRRRGPSDADQQIVARSDARGAFDLRGVPPGRWRLWGHREGLGHGVSGDFDVSVGEVKRGIDFEVPALLANDTISGKVLDPEGRPAGKVFVAYRWVTRSGSGSVSTWSRATGEFEILLNQELPGELTALDKEHGWASAAPLNASPGARDIVLQLAELGAPQTVRLRVHGPQNEPVAGIFLMSREGKPTLGVWIKEPALRVIEPGLYEFLLSRDTFGLNVSAEGYIDSAMISVDPAQLPPVIEVGLEPAPTLHGRVSCAGKTLPDAVVEALPVARKGQSITVSGFPSLMGRHPSVNATADVDGAFTLRLQGKDPVYLRCVAQGFAATVVGPFAVDGTSASIEIELGIGGVIEGRARAKDGTAVVGAIVGITCGDGYPRTMLSGFDGVFRFEGLSVGSWLVMESAEEIGDGTNTTTSHKERQIDWSCTVAAGRTTYFDLTLDR